MNLRRLSINKVLSAALAAVFLFETVAVHAAEASIWAERRRAARTSHSVASNQPVSSPKNSDDSKDKKSSEGESLLASLPAVRPGFSSLPTPDVTLAALPEINANRAVPSWIQTAVSPFATIHKARLTGQPNSPTVLLMQDAHLHVEAQRNIAGAIEALAKDVAGQGEKLLVALEGAPAGPVDYSQYAGSNEALRREVVQALAERNILSGAEVAAVVTAGMKDGKDLFTTIGAENFSMYEANVKALRETTQLRKPANQALSDLKRELVELKRKYFDEDLVAYDGRKDAYEDGKLGLPAYALYLDSVVPASGVNLRELIEAALIEGSLKFGRVESERRTLLSRLVEKMSDAEMKALLQASLLFRSGQVTYAGYYNMVKGLAARHGVPLRDFPELNLYIQYVLKAEAIDHGALFAEITAQEKFVQKKLAANDEQREILALDSDLHLLRKLVDRSLIESEWHQWENRRADWAQLPKRLTTVGASVPDSAKDMADRWKEFDRFYQRALERNEAMVDNLFRIANFELRIKGAINDSTNSQFEIRNSKYAVLVAGGFHSEGLASMLEKKGVNVFILSPRITNIGNGPSSLDFLAEGRLPLNEIFVGERLFVTVPVATAFAGTLRKVEVAINGAIGALERLRASVSGGIEYVYQGFVFLANRGESPAGDLVLRTADDEYVTFVSAFSGKPFDIVMQAVKALPRGQLLGFLEAILGAYGFEVYRGFPSERRDSVLAKIEGLARQAPHLYPNSALLLRMLSWQQMSPNIWLTKALAPVLAAFIEDLRRSNRRTFIDRVLKQNSGLVEVDAPSELQPVLNAVKSQIGLEKLPVTLRYFRNDKNRDYSEVVELKNGDTVIGYEVRVSEEFLADNIKARVKQVKNTSGKSEEGSREWLLNQWAIHELSEAALRRRHHDNSTDIGLQEWAHKSLVEGGLGAELPKNKSDYNQPVAALLLKAMTANKGAWADDAASRVLVPTNAPVAASAKAAVSAKAPSTPIEIEQGGAANVTMSSDGGLIAVAGKELVIYEGNGKRLTSLPLTRVQSMTFMPGNNNVLVVASGKNLYVIDISRPQSAVVGRFESRADAASFSANGGFLITTGDAVNVWSMGELLRTLNESGPKDTAPNQVLDLSALPYASFLAPNAAIRSIALSADGTIAQATTDQEYISWQVSSGKELVRRSLRTERPERSVSAFSADGTLVAVAVFSPQDFNGETVLPTLEVQTTGPDSRVLLRVTDVRYRGVAFDQSGKKVVAVRYDYDDGAGVVYFDVPDPRITTETDQRTPKDASRLVNHPGEFRPSNMPHIAVGDVVVTAGADLVQIQRASPTPAYVGWPRGAVVFLTFVAFSLWGFHLSDVALGIGVYFASILIGFLAFAAYFFVEETAHGWRWEVEYDAIFDELEELKKKKKPTPEVIERIKYLQAEIDYWNELPDPRISLRKLGIENVGDSIGVLAYGQIGAYMVASLMLGIGSLFVTQWALFFFAGLGALLLVTFLNEEAFGGRNIETGHRGGWIRRMIMGSDRRTPRPSQLRPTPTRGAAGSSATRPKPAATSPTFAAPSSSGLSDVWSRFKKSPPRARVLFIIGIGVALGFVIVGPFIIKGFAVGLGTGLGGLFVASGLVVNWRESKGTPSSSTTPTPSTRSTGAGTSGAIAAKLKDLRSQLAESLSPLRNLITLRQFLILNGAAIGVALVTGLIASVGIEGFFMLLIAAAGLSYLGYIGYGIIKFIPEDRTRSPASRTGVTSTSGLGRRVATAVSSVRDRIGRPNLVIAGYALSSVGVIAVVELFGIVNFILFLVVAGCVALIGNVIYRRVMTGPMGTTEPSAFEPSEEVPASRTPRAPPAAAVTTESARRPTTAKPVPTPADAFLNFINLFNSMRASPAAHQRGMTLLRDRRAKLSAQENSALFMALAAYFPQDQTFVQRIAQELYDNRELTSEGARQNLLFLLQILNIDIEPNGTSAATLDGIFDNPRYRIAPVEVRQTALAMFMLRHRDSENYGPTMTSRVADDTQRQARDLAMTTIANELHFNMPSATAVDGRPGRERMSLNDIIAASQSMARLARTSAEIVAYLAEQEEKLKTATGYAARSRILDEAAAHVAGLLARANISPQFVGLRGVNVQMRSLFFGAYVRFVKAYVGDTSSLTGRTRLFLACSRFLQHRASAGAPSILGWTTANSTAQDIVERMNRIIAEAEHRRAEATAALEVQSKGTPGERVEGDGSGNAAPVVDEATRRAAAEKTYPELVRLHRLLDQLLQFKRGEQKQLRGRDNNTVIKRLAQDVAIRLRQQMDAPGPGNAVPISQADRSKDPEGFDFLIADLVAKLRAYAEEIAGLAKETPETILFIILNYSNKRVPVSFNQWLTRAHRAGHVKGFLDACQALPGARSFDEKITKAVNDPYTSNLEFAVAILDILNQVVQSDLTVEQKRDAIRTGIAAVNAITASINGQVIGEQPIIEIQSEGTDLVEVIAADGSVLEAGATVPVERLTHYGLAVSRPDGSQTPVRKARVVAKGKSPGRKKSAEPVSEPSADDPAVAAVLTRLGYAKLRQSQLSPDQIALLLHRVEQVELLLEEISKLAFPGVDERTRGRLREDFRERVLNIVRRASVEQFAFQLLYVVNDLLVHGDVQPADRATLRAAGELALGEAFSEKEGVTLTVEFVDPEVGGPLPENSENRIEITPPPGTIGEKLETGTPVKVKQVWRPGLVARNPADGTEKVLMKAGVSVTAADKDPTGNAPQPQLDRVDESDATNTVKALGSESEWDSLPSDRKARALLVAPLLNEIDALEGHDDLKKSARAQLRTVFFDMDIPNERVVGQLTFTLDVLTMAGGDGLTAAEVANIRRVGLSVMSAIYGKPLEYIEPKVGSVLSAEEVEETKDRIEISAVDDEYDLDTKQPVRVTSVWRVGVAEAGTNNVLVPTGARAVNNGDASPYDNDLIEVAAWDASGNPTLTTPTEANLTPDIEQKLDALPTEQGTPAPDAILQDLVNRHARWNDYSQDPSGREGTLSWRNGQVEEIIRLWEALGGDPLLVQQLRKMQNTYFDNEFMFEVSVVLNLLYAWAYREDGTPRSMFAARVFEHARSRLEWSLIEQNGVIRVPVLGEPFDPLRMKAERNVNKGELPVVTGVRGVTVTTSDWKGWTLTRSAPVTVNAPSKIAEDGSKDGETEKGLLGLGYERSLWQMFLDSGRAKALRRARDINPLVQAIDALVGHDEFKKMMKERLTRVTFVPFTGLSDKDYLKAIYDQVNYLLFEAKALSREERARLSEAGLKALSALVGEPLRFIDPAGAVVPVQGSDRIEISNVRHSGGELGANARVRVDLVWRLGLVRAEGDRTPLFKAGVFATVIEDDNQAQPAAEVPAFYNNKIFEIVADAILNRPGFTAQENVSELADRLYALRDAVGPAFASLGRFLYQLNMMGQFPGRADTKTLTAAIGPIMGAADQLSLVVLEMAGLLPDRTSDKARKLDENLRSILPFFDLGENTDVDIQLMKTDDKDRRTSGKPVAFVQRFGDPITGTRLVIRVSQETLAAISGQQPSGLKIEGTLAAYHQERLKRLGIRLTDQQASDLAIKIFLLHEISEEGLRIKDSALVSMGLVDLGRLVESDKASGLDPERIFVSVDGIVGEIEKRAPGTGTLGGVKPGKNGPSRPTLKRERELAALKTLVKAQPILNELFREPELKNYTLGLSDGHEISFDNENKLDVENFNKFEDSPTAQSRLTAMQAEKDAGREFVEMAVDEINDRFKLGDPSTLTVMDQQGGHKLEADRFDHFLQTRRPGQRFILATLDLTDQVVPSLTAYVAMLEQKKLPGLEVDLRKAQQLLEAVKSHLAAVQNGREDDGRIGVVALEESDQNLIAVDNQGRHDVSRLVEIFKARAKAKFEEVGEIQRVVFISDWRQLVVDTALAADTLMNVNAFLSLERRMKAVTLIAVQA